MQTRVDRVLFERTDFGSFGWIGKVPLSLLEVSDFYAAWHSQSKSFRSDGQKDKDSGYYQGQIQGIEWVKPFLDSLPSFAATFQTQSFRSDDVADKNTVYYQDQPQQGWIAKVPEALLEVFDFYAAWHGLAQSFRSPERANRNQSYYAGQLQETSWIKVFLDSIAYSTEFFAGTDSQTRSFRSRQRPNRASIFYQDRPVFSWLKVPLGLVDVVVSDEREWGGWDDYRPAEDAEIVEIVAIIAQKIIF